MRKETQVFLRNKLYFKEDDVIHSYLNDQHIKITSNKLLIITRLEIVERFDFDFTLIDYSYLEGFKVVNYINSNVRELNEVIKNAREDY